MRLLAQVLVRNVAGSQPAFAAFALATSVRNEMHWAPSGTDTITSGFAAAMLFT